MKSVKLVEVFNSWQGEGKNSGQRMLILRFKRCNRVDEKISCHFCDTKMKMRIFQEAEYSIEKLQEIINEHKTGILVTGGEPSYEPNFDSTVSLLNDLTYSIADVETNGCNLIELIKEVNPEKPVNYMFSPKMFNNDELEYHLKFLDLIKEIPNVYIKVVYEGSGLNDIYLDALHQSGLSERVWLMVEGKTMKELIENSPKVFDMAEKYKFNFSSRNHIIYGFV